MTDPGAGRAPERLLVMAPNWLGDVVMTTPLLTYLHEIARPQFAHGLQIHLAVRDSWAPLFTGDPRLDEVTIVERAGRHGGWRGIFRLAAQWKRNQYDAVILGPPSLRAALVARWAGIARRVGYPGDGRSLLLTDRSTRLARGSLHYSEEMMVLGQHLSGEITPPASAGTLPSLPAMDRIAPLVWGDGPPVWALAPGTTYGEAKTWPLPMVRAFVEQVVGAGNRRLVLLGDGSAAVFASRLREGSAVSWTRSPADAGGVIDLTGRTNLAEAVAALKACEAFVGNDSGLMHVAAALGVPTVGIFGSSNPDWTAPRGRATAWVAADGFPCRPCYRKTCDQPRFCLETVTPEQVEAAVASLLVRADAGGR